VIAFGLSAVAGSFWIAPERVLRALSGWDSDPVSNKIVREIRLPRALLAGLAGVGLAVTGAAYQGLFRNPLADPFVIGSASGAALGAAIVISCGWTTAALGLSAVPFGAFVGALGAVVLVVMLSGLVRGTSLTGLLLAGAAVAAMLSSAVWVVLALERQEPSKAIGWMLGSFAGGDWTIFRATAPWLFVGTISLGLLARPLDALSQGESAARGIGIDVRLTAACVLIAGSLATAAAVAAGGVIGFVGLVAPFLARRAVGNKHAALIPASALVGATLLVLADALARCVIAPEEFPVGVVTALLGGPFFLVVLRGKR
jgi:iron complex transport system permease protein